jgi:predicted component of type VI protein secretion system
VTPGSVWAMKRTLATVATVIAAAAGLTACTDEQAYCVDLGKYAAKAVNVDPQKPVDYVKILDDAKKLQESAPDDVKDDWGVVAAFAEKAQKAGSDRVELAKLSKQTGGVMTAYKNISTHAKDACKVDVPSLN